MRLAARLGLVVVIAASATAFTARGRRSDVAAASQPSETTAIASQGGSRPTASAGLVPSLAPRGVLRPAPMQSHDMSRLRGVVLDEAGRPVPAANLSVYDMAQLHIADRRGIETASAMGGRTDPTGHFDLLVTPGEYGLVADSAGRASAILEPVSVAPGESVSELQLVLSGGSVVEGVVRSYDGSPTSADVSIYRAGEHVALASDYTDDQGHFSFSPLPDGPLEIVAVHLGYRTALQLPRPTRNVALRFPASPRNVRVHVVNTANQPVENANVTVAGGRLSMTTQTDETGLVEIHIDGSELAVSAWNDDAQADPLRIPVPLDSKPDLDVTLMLHPRASLLGRMLDARGAVVAGFAQVTRPDGPAAERVRYYPLDEQGGYRATNLTPGSYTVRYSEEDNAALADAEPALLAVVTGAEQVALGELRLLAEHHITGVVLDAEGKPVANADVEFVDARSTEFYLPNTTTDEAGRFDLVSRGPTRIRATRSLDQSAVVTTTGRGDEHVELQLQTTAFVEGILRGARGDSTAVRCGSGLWHAVDETGQYHLMCPAGVDLEVRSGDEVRHYPVDIAENDFTFAELHW